MFTRAEDSLCVSFIDINTNIILFKSTNFLPSFIERFDSSSLYNLDKNSANTQETGNVYFNYLKQTRRL